MTKTQFIERIAQEVELDKNFIEKIETEDKIRKRKVNNNKIIKDIVTQVVNALPDVVKDVVSKEDKISLLGFMTFEKKHVAETSGVTKLDGTEKAWTKPAHDEIKVSLSKSYKAL